MCEKERKWDTFDILPFTCTNFEGSLEIKEKNKRKKMAHQDEDSERGKKIEGEKKHFCKQQENKENSGGSKGLRESHVG